MTWSVSCRCFAAVGLAALVVGSGALAMPVSPAAATTQNVIPILNCSYKTSNGMYNNEFGYNNPNSSAVTVAVGSQNQFQSGGLPPNAGQPTTFQPGTHSNVFKVTDQQNIAWSLQGTTINAQGNPSCSSDPGAGPWYGNSVVIPSLNCDFANSNGTTTSLFGYTNPFSTTETVAIGSSNNFTGTSSSNAGQPTSFSPGTNASVFVVTHTGGINWFITNNNVSTPAHTKCSTKPVPIVSGDTGSLVVAAVFLVGAALTFVVLRRRPWLRQLLQVPLR